MLTGHIAPDPKPKKNRELKTEILPVTVTPVTSAPTNAAAAKAAQAAKLAAKKALPVTTAKPVEAPGPASAVQTAEEQPKLDALPTTSTTATLSSVEAAFAKTTLAESQNARQKPRVVLPKAAVALPLKPIPTPVLGVHEASSRTAPVETTPMATPRSGSPVQRAP